MVFADSSGFIAAFDRADARHLGAAEAWREIAGKRQKILTTQLVLAETVTHLRRRGGWRLSRDVGDALLSSRAIELMGLSDEVLGAAWREFVRNADPKLSLCDAASFVVMRERRVRHAFTFDRHFALAGFELIPAG